MRARRFGMDQNMRAYGIAISVGTNDQSAASEQQVLSFICLSIAALADLKGLVSLDSASVTFCIAGRKKSRHSASLIEARVRRKELLAGDDNPAPKSSSIGCNQIRSVHPHPDKEMVHLLSPFDPLIIQRKRLPSSSLTMNIASRPTFRRRSGSTAISLCLCCSATRSSPPSISKQIA